MSDLISVAMATYNGERHLLEQLNSLSEQTLLPAELVISDDGSSDKTREVILSFAVNAPFPVRLLPPHPKLGFSDNFLLAAEHCSHELIAFCDQDDVWLPHKLQRASERLEADDSLLALHPLIVTDEQMVPTGLVWSQGIAGDACFDALQLDPYCTGWGNSMLFRRDLITLIPRVRRPAQPERAGLPLSHDTWVYVLAAALGRVSHLSEPLIRYRQHGSSVYGVAPPSPWARIAQAAAFPKERLREEAGFDRDVAALLDEVGKAASPMAAQARLAAERFRERASICDLRLGVHLNPTLASRLTAYRTLHEFESYEPWLGARLKELILGVAGMEKLRRALSR